MTNRVTFVNHKGKSILYINYSHLNSSKPDEEKQILDVLDEITKLVKDKKEKILFLSDVRDTSANTKVMTALKTFATSCKERDIIEKECIVGITGVKKALLSSVNFFAHTAIYNFDTLEQAKDWLVSPDPMK